jgi:hypothetical protein
MAPNFVDDVVWQEGLIRRCQQWTWGRTLWFEKPFELQGGEGVVEGNHG